MKIEYIGGLLVFIYISFVNGACVCYDYQLNISEVRYVAIGKNTESDDELISSHRLSWWGYVLRIFNHCVHYLISAAMRVDWKKANVVCATGVDIYK